MESRSQNPEFRNHPENFQPLWHYLALVFVATENKSEYSIIGHRHEKTCLQGFRPRHIHTRLLSYRDD